MTRNLDRDVILSYVEEAQGYLPTIRNNLIQFFNNPKDLDLLEEAHRHVHTIKGASSMVGFPLLSHMAYLVEDTFEELAAEHLAPSSKLVETLFFTLAQIEAYLKGIADGTANEEELLRSVVLGFRRLRGLPEDGDEKTIQTLLQNHPTDSMTFLPDSGELPEVSARISTDLKHIFQLEAEEHLEVIAKSLQKLTDSPDGKADLQEIRRSMHTLKGSAGLVGFQEITRLAHRSEDLLDEVFHRNLGVSSHHLHLFQDTSDLLNDLLHEDPLSEATHLRLKEIYQRYEIEMESLPEGEAPETTSPAVTPIIPSAPEEGVSEPALVNANTMAQAAGETLRIPQKKLDDLVQTVSDLMIHRTTFEQTLRRLSTQTEELSPSIRRLQKIAGSIEREYEVALFDAGRIVRGATVGVGKTQSASDFDALEMDRYTEFHLLARNLAETTHDLHALSMAIRDVLGDFEGYMQRSTRLTSEAQDHLMQLRMVPLSTMTVRLQRAVRVTANQSQKQVQFQIEGDSIELDKAVLEEMVDPLLHILRNAIDHGIEPPDIRKALGKNPTGTIRLNAFHAGTQVVLEISDDGRGMSLDQLREKAILSGYLSETEANTLSEREIYELVFKPGFSTAGQVSEVSGRGVGLDIVHAVVHRLKGQIQLTTQPNIGVTLSIRLPLTLAILKVILVVSGDETFAIPLSSIRQILQPEEGDLIREGSTLMLRSKNGLIPIHQLRSLVGIPAPQDLDFKPSPILMVETGSRQEGLSVDRLLEAREVVVKNLGRHLRNIPGISGATLMGDGSVVLILNPIDLLRPETARPVLPKVKKLARNRTQILVVDDSVSVRKVLSQLLQKSGYSPITAKDGLEALEILQRMNELPGALVLDLEMPRMDGYELTSLLRGQPRFKELPILILTSRGASRHRTRAESLGATEYLIKPFREEVLVNLLRNYTGHTQ